MSQSEVTLKKNLSIKNRKAYYDYEILDTWEAGIVLTGMEVKAVKNGQVNLKGSHIVVKNVPTPELYLLNAHISAYKKTDPKKLENYDPTRSRKLLLHKKEILRIMGKMQQKSLTVVPLRVYNKKNKIKVEIGLAKGKKLYEKKEKLKERDIKKEADRIIKERMKNSL